MRTRLTVLLLATTTVLIGCSELSEELGLSAEDQEEFEDFIEGLSDAAEAANDAAGGEGSADDGSNGAGSPTDPDWSPDGMPPPPGAPTESSDYSDNGAACPAGHTCGHASYDGDDGEAAREHYEDLFGRPPDTETTQQSSDGENPYDAVSSTWDDGDVEVTVYTDHHGTDVRVEADTATPG